MARKASSLVETALDPSNGSAANAGGDQRIAARGRLAVKTTRFERDKDSGAVCGSIVAAERFDRPREGRFGGFQG